MEILQIGQCLVGLGVGLFQLGLLLAEPLADRVQLVLNPVPRGEAPIGGKKQNRGSEDPSHGRDRVPKTTMLPADAPAPHQMKKAQHSRLDRKSVV